MKKNIIGFIFCCGLSLHSVAQTIYGSYYVKFASTSKSYPSMKAAARLGDGERRVPARLILGSDAVHGRLSAYRLHENVYSLHVGNALSNCYQVDFDNIRTQRANDSIMSLLGSLPDVERVEPATPVQIMDVAPNLPNDPLFHLKRISGAWHLKQIGFEQVYGKYYGSPDIKVAVVDNAVWGNHPDLQVSPENQYFAYIEEEGNSAPPTSVDQFDVSGDMSSNLASQWSHGTHCAGIIAALTDNNEGIASFASGVTLLTARTSNTNPRYMVKQAESILWAVDHGARILSLSWGAPTMSETEQELIKNVIKQGLIVIAAAGNEGSETLNYPAAIDGVIAVGSVDSDNSMSSFSNYGDWVDVAAPGGYLKDADGIISSTADMILSTTYSASVQYHHDGLSEVDGLFYDGKVGTSMSTPLVASVVALMLSVNPALTSSEVLEILQSNATPIVGDLRISPKGGVINAAASLEAVSQTTSVRDASFSPSMSLSLNPDHTLLLINGQAQIHSLRVYDMVGNLLLSASATRKMDVSSLPHGVYIAHANLDGGNVAMKFSK